MTTPSSAADHQSRGRWEEALLTVGLGLDELEQVLADDDWSTEPVLRVHTVDAPLPPQLVEAARSLVSRLAAVEQRLVGELAATRSALADIDTRRSVARNYHQSAAFTSARRSEDD